MESLKSFLYDKFRQRYGRVAIRDPRPVAEENPYTFSLPTRAELAHLQPGHNVKLIFESRPKGRDFDAEQMWVRITHRDGDRFLGVLDNHPADIPQIALGDEISFQAHQVIDVLWIHREDRVRFENREAGQWCVRAEVDPRITREGAPVRFIRREFPKDGKGAVHPDSGWRILSEPDGQWFDVETETLAIGVVLNRDDSILPYLDAPVGSTFRRTSDQEPFSPAGRLH